MAKTKFPPRLVAPLGTSLRKTILHLFLFTSPSISLLIADVVLRHWVIGLDNSS